MTSHFSFAVPAQSTSPTGIRFCRKSPAVGSTDRHWPFGARISTSLKARVAEPSRCCDSAAAVGFRVPPARETGTGVVGLALAVPASVVCPAEPGPEPEEAGSSMAEEAVSVAEAVCSVADAVSSVSEVEGAEVASWLPVETLLTAEAVTVLVRWVQLVEAVVATAVSLLASVSLAGAVVEGALVVPAPVWLALLADVVFPSATPVSLPFPPAAAAPKVKDWLASPELHCAASRALPLTVKQDPTSFSGWNESGPEPPLNLNNCEFVTAPPLMTTVSAHTRPGYKAHGEIFTAVSASAA